jgi:ferric-dicitrate binding protein FerR (iron transport regulator)
VTVARAVDAFNRRNRMQIVVKDPALTQGVVSGSFSSSDPKTFAYFLESRGVASVVTEDPDTSLLIPYTVKPRHDTRK